MDVLARRGIAVILQPSFIHSEGEDLFRDVGPAEEAVPPELPQQVPGVAQLTHAQAAVVVRVEHIEQPTPAGPLRMIGAGT